MKEISSNFYVDDLISGADSDEEASSLLAEAKVVMADAGMTLTKCKSNRPVLFDRTHAASGSGEPESLKVLGVMWNADDDVFSYEGLVLPADVVPTKRVVLSCIARLFDPLGFVSPFVMVAKILFQELWQLGLDWDEALPADRSQLFLDWLSGLESFEAVADPTLLLVGRLAPGRGCVDSRLW